MTLRKDERGQVLLPAALFMLGLLGFMALAVDVGLLLRAKRNLQIAADAGAINSAAELSAGDWSAAGKAAASLNGVTDGTNGAAVMVNNPPTLGFYKGTKGYAEVIVSQSQPTYFMHAFGRDSMMVSVRAVGQAVPNPACIYTLNSASAGSSDSPVGGIYVSGSADLNLPGCGILDNGTGSNAVNVTGGAKLTAASIGVVGSDTVHTGGVLTPTPVTGMSSMSDPLSSSVIAPPASDYSSGCLADPGIKTTTTIVPPAGGYVCYSALTISRSPTVTLNPGLYIINGGILSISGSAIVNGSGVTFYFVNGASFNISNGATLALSAPTAGNYSGLLFYQDPSDSAADSFKGGSSGSIAGIFYLPAANLILANGTVSTFTVDLVVGSLSMTGSATLSPYAPLTGSSPLSTPSLVE